MNKTVELVLKIFIGAVLVIALMMGVFYWKSYKSEANEIADIINKGNAFMEAQIYDEAIGCYEQALEKEENNEQLISAIVEAYMKLAAAYGDSDEALMYYQDAISYYPDNRTAYWAVANIFEARGDEDTMMNVLRQGYSATGDTSMETKVSLIEEERARIQAELDAIAAQEAERLALEQERAQMLEPLVDLFEQKDYDALKEKLRSEEYIEFSEEVIGDTSYYCGNYNEQQKREGTGVAVYENGYYYYGEFHDDERSGHGILFRATYAESSSIGSFIFEGNWENDAPNGEGSATSNYYKDRISASDFSTKTITGNYTDGLEDGKMTLEGVTKGGSKRKFEYTASAGVAEKSSSEDSGVKGQYIIASTSDKSENLTSDGSIRGVEGYVEEE